MSLKLTMATHLTLPVLVLNTSCAVGFVADFTGRVVGISDGDTISVMHGTRAEKIRLNGIDCPEKQQALDNEPSKSPLS